MPWSPALWHRLSPARLCYFEPLSNPDEINSIVPPAEKLGSNLDSPGSTNHPPCGLGSSFQKRSRTQLSTPRRRSISHVSLNLACQPPFRAPGKDVSFFHLR